jgi:uridylate kinase
MGRDLPMTVFDIFAEGNLQRLFAGEHVGTRIATDARTRFVD